MLVVDPFCTYIRESLSAADMLALVGFLSSMRPDMNCQSAPLDEALPTTRDRASVWSFICMYTIMSL